MGLDITGFGALFDFGSKVLDKIFPDPTQRDAAKLELLKQQQAGAFKELEAALSIAQSQTAINQVEASNANTFVSGWRPFIGWVCGTACAWNWIGLPVAVFAASYLGHPLALKPADLGEMMPVLMGMLGLGGLRTLEKIRGVAAQ